jgi:hypothetical protein
MKNYDSRTYSVNDFLEWDKAPGQLVLNPIFQRRAVWSEKAKSFLIDTMLRGKPIPKVFIRQSINVTTRTSIREVVDGQQRLRTILSFLKDGFTVSKKHHPDYGGIRFSQLPGEVQEQFLAYEISVDLLINVPDPEVLDMFSRLNSYSVVLNEQEKLNARYFGPFKTLADRIGHKYYDYWLRQKVMSAKDIMRMGEVNLVADIVTAMLTGIKDKKQVKKSYATFEKAFDHDSNELEAKFDSVIGTINSIFPEGLGDTQFKRSHLFYSLYTAVYHCIYGIPGSNAGRPSLSAEDRIQEARNGLDRVEELFATADEGSLSSVEREFLQDNRRATTDERVRIRRTNFLLGLIS